MGLLAYNLKCNNITENTLSLKEIKKDGFNISWDIKHKPHFNKINNSFLRSKYQKSYCLVIADSLENLKEDNFVYDSQVIRSKDNYIIINFDFHLKELNKYYFKIGIFDNNDFLNWSKVSYFLTGIREDLFLKASWISAFFKRKEIEIKINETKKNIEYEEKPLIRGEFSLNYNGIKSAYLVVCCLGSYQARFNGEILNDFIQEGLSDYQKLIYYQVFDVTNIINKEADLRTHCLAFILNDGWFVKKEDSPFGGKKGNKPAIKFALKITFLTGFNQYIYSNASYRAYPSPYMSQLMHSEFYMQNKEFLFWDKIDFFDKHWQKVSLLKDREYEIWGFFTTSLKELKLVPSRIQEIEKYRENAIKTLEERSDQYGSYYVIEFEKKILGSIEFFLQKSNWSLNKAIVLFYSSNNQVFNNNNLLEDEFKYLDHDVFLYSNYNPPPKFEPETEQDKGKILILGENLKKFKDDRKRHLKNHFSIKNFNTVKIRGLKDLNQDQIKAYNYTSFKRQGSLNTSMDYLNYIFYSVEEYCHNVLFSLPLTFEDSKKGIAFLLDIDLAYDTLNLFFDISPMIYKIFELLSLNQNGFFYDTIIKPTFFTSLFTKTPGYIDASISIAYKYYCDTKDIFF